MDTSRVNQETVKGNRELEGLLKSMITEMRGKYPGNVYIACQSDRSGFYSYLYKDLWVRYNDGSVSVHNTIQAAVNASKQYRGDVVLVMPDKWQENVVVYQKQALKMFGLANGYEMQWRSSDATTKFPYTPYGGTAVGGVCLAVLSRDVEVGKMMFDPDGGHAGLYWGDGDLLVAGGGLASDYGNENSASGYVHDCQFAAGGSSSYYGVTVEGCGDKLKVENCDFEGLLYAGVYVGGYSSRSNQNVVILNNRFLAGASGYGIDQKNIAGGNINTLSQGNSFRDGKSRAFTYAIRNSSTDGVFSTIDDKFACTNACSLQAADFVSGPTMYSKGDAPHFLQDSTNSA
jgi:hypothetical protein